MFDNDRNSRKWQCFVCGKQHTNYQEYNEHILQEHEEGREYIKCPDCGACVRDTRLHYKIIHPKRIMPKNVQLKVAVWRDFSSGKKKTKKPTFKEGYFVSNKMNGNQLHYRSGYECDVYECLEADKEVQAFHAEPFQIGYYFEDKWHKYTPDILVEFTDGRKEIWEIKPSSQTTLKKNKAKWKAMNTHAKENGIEFVVITETGIGKLKQKVKKQRLINE